MSEQILELAGSLTSAYVANNQLPHGEVPQLFRSLYEALNGLSGEGAPSAVLPAGISVKKSVTDEFIVCLEDGRKLRTLKRYLGTQYNLSPEEYRKKWGLPHDYPMVAPAYARLRSAFAKKIGLGRVATSRRRKVGRS